jgi:hypothetical protein
VSGGPTNDQPNHGLTPFEHAGLCIAVGLTLVGLLAWVAAGVALAAYLIVSTSLMLGGA